MLRSNDVGCGAYGARSGEGAGGPGWIARWTLVDGWPRCLEAPLAIADTDPADLAAQVVINRAITAMLKKVEAVEAAQRLLAAGEPPPTLAVMDAAGLVRDEPNPEYLAWQAAQVMLDGLDDDTALLVQTRSGLPDLGADAVIKVAPYQLTLPPVPALDDPTGQTADWDGGAWVLRPLTAAERAAWPLRPASDIAPAQLVGLLRAALGDGGTQAILARPDIASTLLVASRIAWSDVCGADGWCEKLVAAGAVSPAVVEQFLKSWPLAV